MRFLVDKHLFRFSHLNCSMTYRQIFISVPIIKEYIYFHVVIKSVIEKRHLHCNDKPSDIEKYLLNRNDNEHYRRISLITFLLTSLALLCHEWCNIFKIGSTSLQLENSSTSLHYPMIFTQNSLQSFMSIKQTATIRLRDTSAW